MRRWLFALLVLANIGLLMWGVQYLEPERPARTEAPHQVAPERMKLLSEVPANKLAPRPKPPPPPPPAPEQIAETQPCYRLGPIAEAAQLKKLEAALGAQSLAFTKREETTRSVTGYRVFLPPLPSRDEAERRRRELTKLGFRDHALMHDESMQNAISLGLFTVEENAQNHLKRLADKGVKAELQPLEQSHPIYWLDITPTVVTDLPARLRAMLDGVTGADVVEMPCPAPVVPVSPVPEPAGAG